MFRSYKSNTSKTQLKQFQHRRSHKSSHANVCDANVLRLQSNHKKGVWVILEDIVLQNVFRCGHTRAQQCRRSRVTRTTIALFASSVIRTLFFGINFAFGVRKKMMDVFVVLVVLVDVVLLYTFRCGHTHAQQCHRSLFTCTAIALFASSVIRTVFFGINFQFGARKQVMEWFVFRHKPQQVGSRDSRGRGVAAHLLVWGTRAQRGHDSRATCTTRRRRFVS